MNASIFREVFTSDKLALALFTGLAWHLSRIVKHWKQTAEFERNQRVLEADLTKAQRERDTQYFETRLQEVNDFWREEVGRLREEPKLREQLLMETSRRLTQIRLDVDDKDKRLEIARKTYRAQQHNIDILSRRLAMVSARQTLPNTGDGLLASQVASTAIERGAARLIDIQKEF